MIHIDKVTVRFGEKTVLDSIDVQFKPGEIIGLVAPNGTGKSTLLNVLMNYVSPTSGQVIFNENLKYSNQKSEADIHSKITMMADQSDLYNHLNGRDHLNIYKKMWHKTAINPDEVIEALKMNHYVNNKVRTYSLGMRQRLCLAMQIVSNTPFMLMDEVMNGLDPDNVELISKMLEKKREEGKIIVIASHLLENLEKYADRIFFLKDGMFIYETNNETKKRNVQIILTNKNMTSADLKFSSRDNNNVLKKIQNNREPLEYQILTNERVIMNTKQFSGKDIIDIQTLLAEQYSIRSQIGSLDLADRYSLHYKP